MNSENSAIKIRLEKIEIAYTLLDKIQSTFSVHNFSDILDRDQEKSKRIERFFSYCSSAKLLHSRLLGNIAAYFPECIEATSKISSQISMIQGHFNNHIYRGAPDSNPNNPITSYAVAIEHCRLLDELANGVKLSLLNISESTWKNNL